MSEVKVGIIGCGAISEAYLNNLCGRFAGLRVTACADLDHERAQAKAAGHEGVKAVPVGELLADPEIRIVLNLTLPKAHAKVSMQALEAGKSVYSEKPLALNRPDGMAILKTAAAKGLRVGCAPDTFLGAGLQTCRKIIDEGQIGEPVAATAFMLCHGHESWHPDPEFYYEEGGGPMFDMGPYYLAALINLLGPIRRVTGTTRITFPERTIASAKKFGRRIKVEVPTHVAGTMDFRSGVIGTIVTSFDVWAARVPPIEIYGSEGSLSVPNPNGFGGSVQVNRVDGKGWCEVPLTHAYADQSRGLGVSDMAHALELGTAHRANGDLAYHVLDVMLSVGEASREGRHIDLASTCDRPPPLPSGLGNGEAVTG